MTIININYYYLWGIDYSNTPTVTASSWQNLFFYSHNTRYTYKINSANSRAVSIWQSATWQIEFDNKTKWKKWLENKQWTTRSIQSIAYLALTMCKTTRLNNIYTLKHYKLTWLAGCACQFTTSWCGQWRCCALELQDKHRICMIWMN